MATIKAGTYRFNDVLSAPPSEVFEQNLNFNVTALGALAIANQLSIASNTVNYAVAARYNIIECDALVSAGVSLPLSMQVYEYTPDGSGGNGWYTDDFGDGVKTITLPTDTEVSDEFAEWFSANAVEQKQISGVWKFKGVLTEIPYDRFKQGYGTQGKEFMVSNYGANIESIIVNSFEIRRISPVNVFGDVYDYDDSGNYVPTVFDVGMAVSGYVGDTYLVTDVPPSAVASQTVNFGTEEQTVSVEFYNWLTENAAEVVEDKPTATITYNGSTIASLFGGQTATLKCAGMKMESDVVVEVAETPESFEPSGTINITENGEYAVYDYETAVVNIPIPTVEEYDGTITIA